MTAEAGEAEEVTQASLRRLWGPLTCSKKIFDKCIKHSVNFIPPENYSRKYHFLECETIQFQTEKGEVILEIGKKPGEEEEKEVEGEIQLPAKVGVYIRWGKSRQGDMAD